MNTETPIMVLENATPPAPVQVFMNNLPLDDSADQVHIPHPVKALIQERAKLAEENSPEKRAEIQALIERLTEELQEAEQRRMKLVAEQDRRKSRQLAKRRAKNKKAKKSRRRNR